MNTGKKELSCTVIKDKMEKTVVVSHERFVTHPVFKKKITIRKKYKAHDESNSVKVGDRVVIRECRPLSKEKRWVVVQILSTVE